MEKSEFSTDEIMESMRQKQPEPILLGAILSQGNSLQTDKGRFYNLINEIQCGNIPYPNSLRQIVDSISVNENEQYPKSEEIESMFARLSTSKTIDFNNDQFGKNHLQMSDSCLYDFIEQWQDDYDALEFFDRCGNYLSTSEIV